MVPTEHPKKEQPRLDPGPLTTRIVGELSLGEGRTPAHPEPGQLEVTQPYIPAVRDHAPGFAKQPPAGPAPATAAELTTPLAPAPASPQPAPPAPPPGTEPAGRTQSPAQPRPKKRSLARRVIRRIIGPDLLRKDPAPKRK